jgi:hypothetical protein
MNKNQLNHIPEDFEESNGFSEFDNDTVLES